VNARVITIDGARLVELMIETGVGVRTHKVFERYTPLTPKPEGFGLR
jgi:restriction endonuclease Mrr